MKVHKSRGAGSGKREAGSGDDDGNAERGTDESQESRVKSPESGLTTLDSRPSTGSTESRIPNPESRLLIGPDFVRAVERNLAPLAPHLVPGIVARSLLTVKAGDGLSIEQTERFIELTAQSLMLFVGYSAAERAKEEMYATLERYARLPKRRRR